jgi:hypothetical protein
MQALTMAMVNTIFQNFLSTILFQYPILYQQLEAWKLNMLHRLPAQLIKLFKHNLHQTLLYHHLLLAANLQKEGFHHPEVLLLQQAHPSTLQLPNWRFRPLYLLNLLDVTGPSIVNRDTSEFKCLDSWVYC